MEYALPPRAGKLLSGRPDRNLRSLRAGNGALKVSSGWLDATKTMGHTLNRAKKIPIFVLCCRLVLISSS